MSLAPVSLAAGSLWERINPRYFNIPPKAARFSPSTIRYFGEPPIASGRLGAGVIHADDKYSQLMRERWLTRANQGFSWRMAASRKTPDCGQFIAIS